MKYSVGTLQQALALRDAGVSWKQIVRDLDIDQNPGSFAENVRRYKAKRDAGFPPRKPYTRTKPLKEKPPKPTTMRQLLRGLRFGE